MSKNDEKKVPERYNYVLLDRMVEAKYGQYVQYIDYAILQTELAAVEKELRFLNRRVDKDDSLLKLNDKIVAENKRLEEELVERKKQLEVAFEVLEEYTPTEKLQEANDKMILKVKGIAEKAGRDLLKEKGE